MHIFWQELWNNHKYRPYPGKLKKKTETQIEIITVENRKIYKSLKIKRNTTK